MVGTSVSRRDHARSALVFVAAWGLGLRPAAAAEPGDVEPPPAAVEPHAGVAAPQAAQPEAPSPASKRAAYSLPWGLRPAIAPNLLRLDTVVAPANDGTTVASILTGGGKPFSGAPDLGFYGRVGFAHHASDTDAAAIVSNPLVGALYTPELAPGLRLAGFGGVALPIGMGGGNTPDPAERATLAAASRSRGGLDGVLFGSNYLAFAGGLDLAYLVAGFSFQLEGTLVNGLRVRGEAADADESRAAATTGVHVGYLVAKLVNLSVEARLQAFLSDAAPAVANPDAREQLTLSGGARFNVELAPTILARPGLAYSAGLDAPMSDAEVHVVQVDLPFTF